MNDRFMHEFPGMGIGLIFPNDKNLPQTNLDRAKYFFEAIEELGSVVEPLSAEMRVDCRYKELGLENKAISLQYPHWFIHEWPLPEKVKICPTSMPQIIEVPKINKNIFLSWVENALQQKCPDPDENELCWSYIYFGTVRARIYDQKQITKRDTFTLRTDVGNLEYPLETRNDEVWVYSPVDPFVTQPSFTFELYNRGDLPLGINVHWSLWTRTRGEDHNMLIEAVQRIIDKGWLLVNASKDFELSPVKTN